MQRNFSRNRIQLAQVVARELYVSRAQVFFEPVQFRPCPEWATIHGFCAKSGRERIYVVQPIGPVVDDPNLTDKKFAGNPTLSYRSRDLLLVVGEVTNWHGHTPDQIRQMRDGLGRLKAEGAKSLIEVRLSGK